MGILENSSFPRDLKKISPEKLPALAAEIRKKIIETTSRTGGHVAPNLGVVELTIALHRVFETPKDSIVFDVSHQSYAHKILTGRLGNGFENLRKTGGISGFCSRKESVHDAFGAGHAGTAISAALGIAAARDLKCGNEHVVAVVGDAGITNGATLEALNNISAHTRRLIVVLNDNEWSIDKNVGAVADYLNKFITTEVYNKTTKGLRNFMEKYPIGKRLIRVGSAWKKGKKDVLSFGTSPLFENFNLRYLGPIDGHDIAQLISYLEFCKNSDRPILLHVRTKKGKGLEAAEKDPEKFHGCSAFVPETGEILGNAKIPSWQKIFGETLVKLAARDEKIVGITAAMPSGTSLDLLKVAFPKQYFDVGIAEGHAVIFAAGMAANGFKPCVAVYSTFIQRAVDMVFHDVCLQNLPVVFCLDRAGLSPQDGATHHGLFDISLLRAFPNLVIMQPKDDFELASMLASAFEMNRPVAIRYPRGKARGVAVPAAPENFEKIELGKSEISLHGNDGGEIFIWALGNPFLEIAHEIAEKISRSRGGKIPTVVNARFAKPLDEERIFAQSKTAKLFVTLEDNAICGGFGSAFLEKISAKKIGVPVEVFGWEDEIISHGNSDEEIRERHGLSAEKIFEKLRERLETL